MKSISYILGVITLISAFILLMAEVNISQSKYKYVGVNTCVGACHRLESQGNQYVVWKNSKHAGAFLTLQTKAADSIAKALGHNTSASETKECLKCHVLGKDFSENEVKSSFDMTQGVQCESCHGPGSAYKKLSVMKDSSKAVSKGLIIHTEKEKWCITCHNPESPTYIPFDYEPMWEMIAHNKIKPE
jgi:hypothetical protein